MSFDADLAVVGGGLGGLAAAISAAKEGLAVVVLERGPYSGSKNVSGGRIYVHSLLKLVPDALERAPLERPITRETYEVHCGERKVIFTFQRRNRESFSVLRVRLDQWLAKEAEANGALLSYETQVTGARREGGGITLETNRGEFKVPLVVEADGATAPLSRYLGIRRLRADHFMVGVKEVVSWTPDLPEDEGEAKVVLGLTPGLKGGGFVYTNRDSLSIGFTVKVESIQEKLVRTSELIEDFREALGVEGEVLEYSAHLIPYVGYGGMPPLSSPNLMVVGDAAGMLLSDGFVIRGMDLAIGAGTIAGKVAAKLRELNDYSRTYLYDKELEGTFVMRDLKSAWRSFKGLSNPRLYDKYPSVICDVLEAMFSVGDRRLLKVTEERLRGEGVGLTDAVRDLLWFV
ncbi:FAD-dependent oxidoreductase [Sulfodiicoccus acidiphilus]|uniref:FAD-dependent oxidoreductase n=1 Tax=Sulfodiicoccus acidiphilus TaxID=1670455 RepID=A0A348B6L9_9CREN|nr:FAD-dependent oxidoreductase [Sulfodiicoccus acidiphilus]BBD73821.1 FAD-dependent oxidoreductase [Sulfodiicoccus acidiphilus]GGT96500.1 FAD-dependent oxidoreductase [Sulfodiicoccus acidiphilus]